MTVLHPMPQKRHEPPWWTGALIVVLFAVAIAVMYHLCYCVYLFFRGLLR